MSGAPRLFHLQFGDAGGTERFFVRLVQAFHDRGAAQGFGIRPGVAWRGEVADAGEIHEGRFLRRTPGGLLARRALRARIAAFRPDAVIAWRAPAARLLPGRPGGGRPLSPPVRLVRLGDYPRHLRHFGAVDGLVGNTPGVVAHCRDLGWAGRAEVISNFPPPPGDAVMPRSALDTPEGVPLACVVARLVPTKGVDTALRAVAQTPGLWLWVVGDGPEGEALRGLARDLGIADRVRFAGWAEDPGPHIRAADVFCVPSRQEPLGNVVLEGWAAGTPVVTTRSEGPDWFATDGEDSLLTPIDDAGAMAGAMGRVLADAGLGARLAEGGRRTLVRRFSRGAVVDAYLALIAELASAR